MSTIHSVAVIGAGMAGAIAARHLAGAGVNVLVLDKGRTVGGRMSTRRLSGDLSFDHGAQYFTARDPRFVAAVAAWVADGVAEPWPAEPGWFVGTPTMRAPAEALTRDLDVLTRCTVTQVHRDSEGWRLTVAGGEPVAGGRRFDALLVTAPAPQAALLLATAGVSLPELDRVRYAPCWALMLAHDGPSPLAQTFWRGSDPAAPVAWLAQNNTKPGRPARPVALVAHASPDWSRRHLEDEAPHVEALLRAEVAGHVGGALQATAAVAHRWRYALVETAIGEPCLWRPEIGLGFAGDGCLGGRVEAAYLSGLALAERVLSDA
ncbi:MAG: FAD-dependent oxidoreductase [Methylobacteriaceae bacterium]|nr:FAD-dependent oxidoreductase [Methylobacteriaceae bacterium]